MYPRLYRERGTKPTADYTVLVSQGRAVGGSTLTSFCLCFRTPHQILAYWAERFGLAELSHESMFPHFERVGADDPGRRNGPEQVNANNRSVDAWRRAVSVSAGGFSVTTGPIAWGAATARSVAPMIARAMR